MEDERSASTRVVAMSDGQNYIGDVQILQEEGDPYEKDKKQEILRRLRTHGWLTLMPAYEFYCPMLRNEQGQLSRQAMVTHPDFILAHAKVPIHLRVNKLYFFDALDPIDRKKYDEMIATADKQLESALQNVRAQASAIEVVPGSVLNRDGAFRATEVKRHA